MNLIPETIQSDEFPLHSSISELIDDAWETIQLVELRNRKSPIKGFHPSDFVGAYYRLFELNRRLRGPDGHSVPSHQRPSFCEWGSGLGVVACLAERIGFQCTAIEVDKTLHRAALDWHDRHGSQVRLLQGSFIPDDALHSKTTGNSPDPPPRKLELTGGASDKSGYGEESMWLDLNAKSVFDCQNPSLSPTDFDVIYAYPWPGEAEFMYSLFKKISRPGAYLLTFHGAGQFHLHRNP